MSDAEILSALKVDLQIVGTGYDARLTQIIAAAKDLIIQEGAALDTAGSQEDSQIVIMYAAWLWRRRDTMDGMPRMLRWALNNKVLAGKMG